MFENTRCKELGRLEAKGGQDLQMRGFAARKRDDVSAS